MSQQKAVSSRDRWLTLILILAVAVCSVAFGFWIGTFSPRKVEKIYFLSCEWIEDDCVLNIFNTGADELIIDKVWINGTLLDSSEWESFPSMRFQPGDQGALYITASLEIFQQGTTYLFTIQTLAGNSFSHTAKPQASQFTFMRTEELKIKTHRWVISGGAATAIELKVQNTGTPALTMEDAQVNNQSPTSHNATTTLDQVTSYGSESHMDSSTVQSTTSQY